jgi:hypothetical protein
MIRKTKQEIKRHFKEKEKANEYPNANTISRIIECHMNYKTRLLLLQTDTRIVRYYRDIIMRIWRLIYSEIYYKTDGARNGFDKSHFRQMVIAILYMLKKGIGVVLDGPSSECSTPSGSIRESTECMQITKSESDITIQTIEHGENMVNVITFGDDMDQDESPLIEQVRCNSEYIARIQIMDKDDFLIVNLPQESDLKKITCSVTSKKNYAKQDITRGTHLIKKEFRKIKDPILLEKTKKILQEHVSNNTYLFDQMRY